ncbi:methyltransferase domain-containing protein [Rudanella paleaurantiibacter]|uniref:Methyltransferase domain-containing protein n=1 Tax=Rudanella paleaurantiibacter TaxID=2614655 RepID=A0A7J5TY32_9BACT|nr:class I SAM-dependent methyltransferase [Rudanella paleaurantiibacter]KAB7730048.1 methyltransferase domain-containing protein [Rudanella paleaurantiibacter]
MTFDTIASAYDPLARLVFGRSLQRAQIRLLPRLPPGGRWLILGGGTGWLLEQVLDQCAPDYVLYLEASGQMLALSEKRVQRHPARNRVQFRQGTEASLSQQEPFSVILTPFVLDLFSESWLAERMIPQLLQHLATGGYWLVTDFVPTNVWWQRGLVGAMHLFFRWTAGLRSNRLPDWLPLIQQRLPSVAQEAAVNGMVLSVLFSRSSAASP